MRLAYLDPHPVPDDSPEALQILQTVDALGRLGVELYLVTPRPVQSVEGILGRPLSARVSLLPYDAPRLLSRFSNRPFYRHAERQLARLAPDVVLLRNLKLADRLLAQPGHPPLFFETHEHFARSFQEEHPLDSWKRRRKGYLLQQREARVYTRCQGLLTITPHLYPDLQAAYGFDTPHRVAPSGVDLELASRSRVSPATGGPPTILYLGSLHRWKGLETALQAMGQVEGALLRIVGGEDGRIAELQALARQLGVADKVDFAGRIAPLRRFEAIAQADICLLPLSHTGLGSRYTSPLKLFEYLAMGKAVVAGDLPTIRDVLHHGENGWLVNPEDPTALADGLNTLLRDEALRHRLGEAGVLVARRYSWAERARQMLEFFQQHGKPTENVTPLAARESV
ncbi:MAG: glycosyltransferase family 4 protein [Magnetococcales bacterium]|nr:glycosyltransferase family 4 protein [Magnetococcales bacterium]